MKSNHSAIFLFLFLSLTSLAQQKQNEKHKIKFGFNAGPNLTYASLSSYVPTLPDFGRYKTSDYKIWLNIEGFVLIPFSANFSFQTELGFGMYKQKQVYGDLPGLLSPGSTNNYDELSESAITLGGIFQYKTKYFFISAGPQLALITSTNVNTDTKTVSYDATTDQYSGENFKQDGKLHNPSFSFLFGISKDDIYKNLGVGIYYQLGLTNFTEYYNNREVAKVNGFLLKISYTFKQ